MKRAVALVSARGAIIDIAMRRADLRQRTPAPPAGSRIVPFVLPPPLQPKGKS